jgi:hypothetical protein
MLFEPPENPSSILVVPTLARGRCPEGGVRSWALFEGRIENFFLDCPLCRHRARKIGGGVYKDVVGSRQSVWSKNAKQRSS